MKKLEAGLGKYVYTEWLFPIKDYYCSIHRNEVFFEIVIPLICAGFCSYSYSLVDKVFQALNGLSNLLPTAISILIGFTVMLITLLLTSSGDSMEKIKNTTTDKELYGNAISLYQGLHIQFSHSLFSEITLLLVIFIYLFWKGLGMPSGIAVVFLGIEVYLTLNILLSILRGITSLYFSFYGSEAGENKHKDMSDHLGKNVKG